MIKNWQDYPSGREKYQLYLASREWAEKKRSVHVRSKGQCERCKNASGDQVHHQTYERIYQESLADLVHLCAPCHEFISGKRNDDPIWTAPVLFFGRKIKTVYLAGKISGDGWRDQIIDGWSFENHSPLFDVQIYLRDGRGSWEVSSSIIPTPMGNRLDYTGPYWRPVAGYGGHSWLGNAQGAHAYGVPIGKPHECDFVTDGREVHSEIISSILGSDLIFAWIDSLDCFGTLVEIGIAHGSGRNVVVACPPAFLDRELWVAFSSADLIVRAKTPGEAWKALWSTPAWAEERGDAAEDTYELTDEGVHEDASSADGSSTA